MKPIVRDAIYEAMRVSGNPSSVHRAGRLARRLVETARGRVAALAGAKPQSIVFTAGGTEANNLAIYSAAANGVERLIVSTIEHASVSAAAEVSALDVSELPVSQAGVADLNALEANLAGDSRRALVLLMSANNETGVIQPIKAAVALAKQFNALVHVDAVQSFGKEPISFESLGAASIALSSHKIAGPTGVGALVVGDSIIIRPLINGGGQELGRRGGTQNVPGIVGFGVAADAISKSGNQMAELEALRDHFESQLRAQTPSVVVLGADAPRLRNTSCFAVADLRAETAVMALDLAGVCVSAGAACSSGKVATSHVAEAMGLPEAIAGSSIRMSLGWASSHEDIDRFFEAWPKVVKRAGHASDEGSNGAMRARVGE